jgi:hypothetical protein
MEELAWLEKFIGRSTDEFLALSNRYSLESMIMVLGCDLDQKAQRMGSEGLSEQERCFLAIEALEREVNNGGFSQFFCNSSCEYAPIIVRSLTQIGCPETAKITQTAIDALGVQELTSEAVEEAVATDNDERDEKLDACDQQYFASGENIADMLFEFVRTNKDSIRPWNS